MPDTAYLQRRAQIEHYFDRTAAKAWERLTSDAPLGRIRASVRAGRDAMRATLLQWLPLDLHGARVLDAGCGTGVLAQALAERGAEVVAVDLSPTLIELAKQRQSAASVHFMAGDMLDEALGRFDYVVAMDSLIHYEPQQLADALQRLAPRVARAVLLTFAPRTPVLALMHGVGRWFPRGDRSPALQPMAQDRLRPLISQALGVAWQEGRTQRVAHGFYTSQAWEWHQ
jgi:magnesium-protoporphyrin O-methyltransferase